MTSVLVTGATGFVGHHLAKYLSDFYKVHALYREKFPIEKMINWHRVPVTAKEWDHFFQENPIQIVFHLAAKYVPAHQSQDLKPLVESNVLFSLELMDAMVRSQVPYLVIAGTFYEAIPESSLYAALKRSVNEVARYYVAQEKLKVLSLQLSETYGEGDMRKKVLNLLLSAQGKLELTGGEQSLDYVHISDVCEAFRLAGNRVQSKGVEFFEKYSVHSGRAITLKKLVELVETLRGEKLSIRWGALPYRPGTYPLKREYEKWVPGWAPKIELEDGLRRKGHPPS